MRRATRPIGMVALTAFYTIAYAIHSRLRRDENQEALRQRWVRRWSRSLLRLFGIALEIHGDVSRGDGEGGVLVAANHRSPADILVLLNAFAGYIISRADVARWPVIGPAARSIGTVFVDRSDNASATSALQTIQRLLTAGRTVIVFPEATIFEGDEVRPFKGGSFAATRRTGTDVLPVGIAYETGSEAASENTSFLGHAARIAASGGSRVVLHIGAPIAASSYADTDALSTIVRESVQRLVADARRDVDRERAFSS